MEEIRLSWAAVQQQHAIERIRIEIAFTEPLPSRVVESAKRQFEQNRNALRFASAVPQEVHQLGIQPGLGGAPTFQKVVGWNSVRESSPGVAVESVALNPGGFAYESTDYRSWETAHRRFRSVADSIIQQVSTVVDIGSFSLDYADRFVYQGRPAEAEPGAILVPDLLCSLTEGARSGEFLWHLHRGWFDLQEGRSVLMNQNVDAQDAKTHTGALVRSLQIFTRAEFRPQPEQFRVEDLRAIADQLHVLCNFHFASILTDDAKNMVGLLRDRAVEGL